MFDISLNWTINYKRQRWVIFLSLFQLKDGLVSRRLASIYITFVPPPINIPINVRQSHSLLCPKERLTNVFLMMTDKKVLAAEYHKENQSCKQYLRRDLPAMLGSWYVASFLCKTNCKSLVISTWLSVNQVQLRDTVTIEYLFMRLFMYKFIYLLSLAVRWDGWISPLLREIIFCSVLPQPIGKLNSLDLSFDQKTNFARKSQRCCHPHVYFYFRSHFSLHCVTFSSPFKGLISQF